MNRLILFLMTAWLVAAADSSCSGEGQESQSCIQVPSPRRGASQIQISDRGICKCAQEFEEAVAAAKQERKTKASLVAADGEKEATPLENFTVDWGWGTCAPFCKDNGCACLRPWSDRCTIESCSGCDPCKPAVECQVPSLPTGGTGYSTGCTPGQSVAEGITCTITPSSGYTCVDPGECGSNGQFAATPSCQAPPASTVCVVPDLPTGGTSYSNGCTAGQTVNEGFTCTISTAGDYTCEDPGQCGSDGKFPQTPTCTLLPAAVCMLAGDPHVKVFDVKKFAATAWSAADFYDAGDYWIVKSDKIKIQGRLVGLAGRHGGNAMIEAIAISGPFIKGNKLIIEKGTGSVYWNSKTIMSTLGDGFTQAIDATSVSAKYHTDGSALRNTVTPPATVDVNLPLDVQVKANRFPGHLDVMITMRQQPQQDGLCGNFNLAENDDLESDIKTRIDYPAKSIDSVETFFATPFTSLVQSQGGKQNTKQDCSSSSSAFSDATNKCKDAMGAGASDSMLKACAYDTCNGGAEFASQYAATSDQMVAVTKQVEEKNKMAETCTGWCLYPGGAKMRCETEDGTTDAKVDVPDLAACQKHAEEVGHPFITFRMRSDPKKPGLCLSTLRCDTTVDGSAYNWTIYELIGPVESTETAQIDCGGHTAHTCAECPQGNGEAWCNGECQWQEDACVAKAPTYTDLGVGKCTVSGEDPKHEYHEGQGSECQNLCSASPACHGYTASNVNNCLLWLETGLTGGGIAWGDGHCRAKA